MLSRQQIAEVVAFDREYRKPRYNRRVIRYNYIVQRARGEVAVVNVAVRLDRLYVPDVKEVEWMHPATGWMECRDLRYHGIAGWTVAWRRSSLSRHGQGFGAARGPVPSAAPFRLSPYVDGKSYRLDYKFGRSGVNRSRDPTVNVHALAGTRYQYCQYSDALHSRAGLFEWLMLYNSEPKVELLAKCGLCCLVTPAGLKALRDRRVFSWVRDHVETLRGYGRPPVSCVLWAARHDSTLEAARDHYERVHSLSYSLDHVRWVLRHPAADYLARQPVNVRFDYDRLDALLAKWRVSADEYSRYVEHAFKLGHDLRNDGTLYPPTRGGRKAFMARLESLEAEWAKLVARREREELRRRRAEKRAEARWISANMKVRAAEIKAFQKSLRRTATLRGCGYTLVLAKSQKELLREGRRMGNCVGNGVYGRGVILGDRLIVMLGLRGRSYCDIEIERRNWTVRQCYLKCNSTPPEEVRKLAAQIAAALKAEHRRHKKLGLFKVKKAA